MKKTLLCFVVLWLFPVSGCNAAPVEKPAASLQEPTALAATEYSDAHGVTWQANGVEASLGGTDAPLQILLGPNREAQTLPEAKVEKKDGALTLTHRFEVAGSAVTLTRRVKPQAGGVVETLHLVANPPLRTDVEVVWPWSLRTTLKAAAPVQTVWPLLNGWAFPTPLSAKETRAEFRLGSVLSGAETAQLALPVVQLSGDKWRAALCADPLYGALFEAQADGKGASGALRFRYTASRVPLSDETRTFALKIAAETKKPQDAFPATLDSFFATMLPDVPPGPKWLHDVAMISYDYLSDGGKGFERDVKALAAMLKPAERKRVTLVFHGWYDGLGAYCYDEKTGVLKESWTAFPRTRAVPFTQAEVKRQLKVARDLGFRVLMYYADGVLADSGQPWYQADRALKTADGNFVTGWQGPDTVGVTHAQNPAHPDVRKFYEGYLDALIETYGDDVDGFVWDETFYIRTGMVSQNPPAYADRAMVTLAKTLREKVKQKLGAEKVFLTSDAHGVFGWRDVPLTAIWADGTYQDTHFRPSVWSFGLFPNWRNTIWGCNWEPITHFDYTKWGVQKLGVPVAISNGWADDKGPHEWNAAQQEQFLALFRERLQGGERIRFLKQNPRELLADAPHEDGAASVDVNTGSILGNATETAPTTGQDPILGDSIPEPADGEKNWALASNQATANASSEADQTRNWTANGVIDGRRDDAGWGQGHGWASQLGALLPQWLEVDFPQERQINRFVIITYHQTGSAETAAKWGVTNYLVQIWDSAAKNWKTVVREAASRTVKTRVHRLAAPVKTTKFRVYVTAVAPTDKIARLLQVEAWGTN